MKFVQIIKSLEYLNSKKKIMKLTFDLYISMYNFHLRTTFLIFAMCQNLIKTKL
jgi:hypothetical protein